MTAKLIPMVCLGDESGAAVQASRPSATGTMLRDTPRGQRLNEPHYLNLLLRRQQEMTPLRVSRKEADLATANTIDRGLNIFGTNPATLNRDLGPYRAGAWPSPQHRHKHRDTIQLFPTQVNLRNARKQELYSRSSKQGKGWAAEVIEAKHEVWKP